MDLDDQLMQSIVERFGSERTFREGERAVRLAMGEQRRRPAPRISGRGRDARPLHLKPGVE